jgi:hypothetical protein
MDGAYDFSSPFASAHIVNKDGTRIPLWTNSRGPTSTVVSGGTGTTTSPVDISLGIVTEISIEMQLAHLAKISVTLNPPIQDVLTLLDSDLITWGQSAIEVIFGYIGGAAQGPVLSPPFTGLAMKPDVNIGTDTSITLTGYGSLYSAVSSAGALTAKTGTIKELIVMCVAGWDPANPRNVVCDFTHADADPDSHRLLLHQMTIVPAGQSDWFTIYRLCRMCGCVFHQVGDKLLILSRDKMLTDPPALKFVFFPGRLITPVSFKAAGKDQEAIFPILNATTPNWGAIFLPGMGRKLGQVAKGINPNTGENFAFDRGEDAVKPARSKDGGASPAASPEFPGVNGQDGSFDGAEPTRVDDPDNPNTLAMMKGEYSAATADMGVKLDIDTLGCPMLLPGFAVKIEGLGNRMMSANNWGVFKVTHTYNTGGFSTSFEAICNTVAMLKNVDPMLGQFGTLDADSSGGMDVEVQSQPPGDTGSATPPAWLTNSVKGV